MVKKNVEIDVFLEEDNTWDVEVVYLDQTGEWVLDEDLSEAHLPSKEAVQQYINELRNNPKLEVGKVTEKEK